MLIKKRTTNSKIVLHSNKCNTIFINRPRVSLSRLLIMNIFTSAENRNTGMRHVVSARSWKSVVSFAWDRRFLYFDFLVPKMIGWYSLHSISILLELNIYYTSFLWLNTYFIYYKWESKVLQEYFYWVSLIEENKCKIHKIVKNQKFWDNNPWTFYNSICFGIFQGTLSCLFGLWESHMREKFKILWVEHCTQLRLPDNSYKIIL